MSGGCILCIGAAAVDRKYRALQRLEPDTSNPVVSERTAGGVARNVAENLARLDVPTSFVSLVGEDDNGRFLLESLRALGIDASGVRSTAVYPTAEYVAVLQPDGALAFGLADMAVFDAVGPDLLDGVDLSGFDWVFADCNLPATVLGRLVALAGSDCFRLAVDAVSTAKVRRLPRDLTGIAVLFLNEAESRAYLDEPLSGAAAAEALRTRGAEAVVLTLGSEGLVVSDPSGTTRAPARACSVVDVTGAGDALVAATLHRLMAGDDPIAAARAGAAAAALTLESRASVRPDLSPELLRRGMDHSGPLPAW